MTIALNDTERRELLERFLRYVRIDTQSDDSSTTSPSTEKQKDLSRLLADELRALGCTDAAMDEFGYVFATVPANPPDLGAKVPVIGLLAHVDTYHGTVGKDVKPQVLTYAGGDLPLPGDPSVVLKAADNPNLARCIGHTIVTTDGTTLLGADDKAGVAEIMTLVAYMKSHPEFRHGTVRVAFTTDEEVGRGTEHFDVAKFGAQYAYTLDGSDLGEIEDETFCADSANVTLTGIDVHPGYAKGKMVNAVRAAAALIGSIPTDRLPETTEGREPYLHPYDVKGDVTKMDVKFLVRAFTEEELAEREEVLRGCVKAVEAQFPGLKAEIAIKQSYRNMGYKIAEKREVVDYAFEAVARMGLTLSRKAIRGGTDGARLSFEGLPTPNVWAGGQNFHSVREWVSHEWMVKAVETTAVLLDVWVQKTAG